MPRYIKKIWSGDVYEAEEYYSPRCIGKNYERGRNELLTSKEQQERNLRYARKKLSRKINANFKRGDLFITLTHIDRVDYVEARHQLGNFLKRLKRWRKKHGLEPLKYIAVTEEGKSKRKHHHLIINGMGISLQELTDLWGLGRVMVSQLEPGGDYTGLAKYITKECLPDRSKRWTCSRNLVDPKIKVVEMKSEKPKRRMTVPKGYREVERYEYISDEIGGMRYLKAIRLGGEDYAEGGKQDEQSYFDGTIDQGPRGTLYTRR